MPRGKLFESWTYKLPLPEPFDNPVYMGAKDFGQSVYNTAGRIRKATMHAPTIRALLAYCRLVLASEAGNSTEDLGAIGHQDDTYHLAEYRGKDKTDCVVFNPTTGKFIAGQFMDGNDTPKPYSLGAGAATGTALLFCLMPVLQDDKEFQDNFAGFKEQVRDNWSDMDFAYECTMTLCDNIYRRIESAKSLGNAGVSLNIPSTGNVSSLSTLALDSGSYAPTGALYGEFNILHSGNGSSETEAAPDLSKLVGQFQISQRVLTSREEAMVPQLPDWYIVPKEAIRVCEHAQLTTETSQPMRNFMFRGEAGTGKTMAAQAIAAGLHLPYTVMTCNANTEISDLIGQFIPDQGKHEAATSESAGELPSVADIIMHPPSVYKDLTGEYDDGKTEDDVLQKLIEIAVGRLAAKEGGNHQMVRYVDTPLIEAIRYGYVVELQEPSCIANPGVLVGLNALMDNCQTIMLPTGERIHRHPDTVIVVTTNSDYAGCRDVNQSVLSRMDLIYDVETPSLGTMVRRVMNITGCTDEQETRKMAQVVQDIAERCRQTMITDGSCGMRELKAWVQSTMVTKDPYESALSTVISSASADPENRADLISTCLEKQYIKTI